MSCVHVLCCSVVGRWVESSVPYTGLSILFLRRAFVLIEAMSEMRMEKNVRNTDLIMLHITDSCEDALLDC